MILFKNIKCWSGKNKIRENKFYIKNKLNSAKVLKRKVKGESGRSGRCACHRVREEKNRIGEKIVELAIY